MVRAYLACLLAAGGGFAAAAQQAESPARIFIGGGLLIDGSGAEPEENPGILIEDERIRSLGGEAAAGPGTEVISADGKWVLPGLFDLHVHITFMLSGPRRLDDDIFNAIRSERFLERYQEIGVTTVRDVGAREWIGYSLKRTQRAGLMGGARYYTSGPIITVTGGHGSEFQPLAPPPVGGGSRRTLGTAETGKGSGQAGGRFDQGRPVPDGRGNGRGGR